MQVFSSLPLTRLVLLIDWSEKLKLTPPASAGCGVYISLGLLPVIAILHRADGQVEVCTHGVLFESDKNDAPHTHAGLLKLLTTYIAICGRTLAFVDIISDGGKGHFKCKEGLCLACHLQAWLRQHAHPDTRLTWHFMQSYHGKGPYDAEGGLIKYYIRIEMRLRNRAFTDYVEVVTWLQSCEGLTNPTRTSCNTYSQSKKFQITRREFHGVSELSLSFSGKADAAKCLAGYGGSLRGLASSVFFVTFDTFPVIQAGGTPALPIGVPGVDIAVAVPPYTLASVQVSGVRFTGHWRALTCLCDGCSRGDRTA